MVRHLPQTSSQSGISGLVAYKGVGKCKDMALQIQTFSSIFEKLVPCF